MSRKRKRKNTPKYDVHNVDQYLCLAYVANHQRKNPIEPTKRAAVGTIKESRAHLALVKVLVENGDWQLFWAIYNNECFSLGIENQQDLLRFGLLIAAIKKDNSATIRLLEALKRHPAKSLEQAVFKRLFAAEATQLQLARAIQYICTDEYAAPFSRHDLYLSTFGFYAAVFIMFATAIKEDVDPTLKTALNNLKVKLNKLANSLLEKQFTFTRYKKSQRFDVLAAYHLLLLVRILPNAITDGDLLKLQKKLKTELPGSIEEWMSPTSSSKRCKQPVALVHTERKFVQLRL